MHFYTGLINLSEGRLRGIIIFQEVFGRSSLAQFQVAASAGTSLWQVCDWSCRIIGQLSGGSARTRDQSDLRKRHFHFGRRNTTAEMAATRMLPPCLNRAGLVPVRLRQQFFPHKDISPQPPLVEPIEHLKTVGQL